MPDRMDPMPDSEVPEADYVEQQRPVIDEAPDPEAPADAPAEPNVPADASVADALEQSREVLSDPPEDDREE